MTDITQDDEHDLLVIQPSPSPSSIPLTEDVGDSNDIGNNNRLSNESHHHDHSHHHDVTLDDTRPRRDQDQDQDQDHLIHASLDIPAGPYSLSDLPQEQESHLTLPSHSNHGQIEDEPNSDHIQHVQLIPSSSSSSSTALSHPSGRLEHHHHQLSEPSSSQSPQTGPQSQQSSQRLINPSRQLHQPRQSTGSDVSIPKRKYKARCKWSAQDKETLVRELVRQKDMGNQLGSGFLPESWVVVANLLAGSEDKSGGDPKGPDECKSAFSRLKREFIRVKQLKRSFAQWNDEDQRPEADPATIKTFLTAHPAYSPYITGWPFFNSMEHINMGITTLNASIAKPLATNLMSYSGAEVDKGEESDQESDTSDISSSRSTERRKRTSSNAGLDLTDPAVISTNGISNANGRQFTGGPASSKRRNTTTIGDGAVESVGKESLSIVRHRARELLWRDVKEEGWSLTEQDIVNVLGRFDENATYAETYADIPYFTLRLLYLQSITFPKLI